LSVGIVGDLDEMNIGLYHEIIILVFEGAWDFAQKKELGYILFLEFLST
jgi:hypothetical protein